MSETGDNRPLSFGQRLDDLEKRIAGLKDFKAKFEEAQEIIKGLRKRLLSQDKLREGLVEFLGLDGANPPAAGKKGATALALTGEHLQVTIAHADRVVNMRTDTVMGKIIFVALKDLPKEGFAETEISHALIEHGWNVPHATLGRTLSSTVQQGYLVKVKKTKPMKYRLPEKVTVNVADAASK